jgi:hypothetical protein
MRLCSSPFLPALAAASFLFAATPATRAQPVISELMASNTSTLIDQDGDFADWLELSNPGTAPVDLTGWYLTNKATKLTKWKIPSVTLPAAGYLVVFCSEKNYTDPSEPLATTFNLSAGGGYLALVEPDGKTIANSYTYPVQYGDVSYGVSQPTNSSQQPQIGYFETPTPGEPNGGTSNILLPDVATISAPPGIFTGSMSVALGGASATEHIRYVLASPSASGDMVAAPTASSPLYTGPISFASTTLLKAAVFSSDDSQRGLPATAMFVQMDNTTANRLDEFTSNLPLVVFDDNGFGMLPDNSAYYPGWIAAFSPVANGTASLSRAPDFFTPDTFKDHGASSAGAPKQSYDIDLADTLGDDLDQPFFGMDDEKSWDSIGVWFFDRTYIHNAFVYSLANSMGHWAARTKFAEMFIHSGGGSLDMTSYAGVTAITDRIKVADSRVNIYSLQVDDITAPNDTGGYILRIDHGENDLYGWTTSAGIAIMLDTPKLDVLVQPQITFITNYVQAMENAMYGDLHSGWATHTYLNYLDRPSWVDYHIMNVFVENVDAFQFSEYFSKDVNGLVVAGPVWDYDRSMGSADGRDINPQAWSAGGLSVWTMNWWGVLAQDPDFIQAWIDRWQTMRGGLFSTTNLNSLITTLSAQIGPAAAARDAARWPEDASRFGGAWSGEIANMSSWITTRAQWIDGQFYQPPAVATTGASRVMTPQGAQIVYTLDGSDPRLPGGAVSSLALVSTVPVTLPLEQVYAARSYNGAGAGKPAPASPWSSLIGGQDRLVNVSCRAMVGGGSGILTEGFVVSGPVNSQEQVLLRAVGPALAQFGVGSGALAQPVLSVFDSSGNLIASNTGWSSADNAASIPNAAVVAGTFALPSGSADSALLLNLVPGNYTLQVSGANQGSGIVLAEVYEIGSSGSKVINLSSSGFVSAGNGSLTNGFYVAGSAPQQVLVRGDGPSLSLFGVTSPLAQPVLQLFDSNGTLVASNAGWGTNANASQVAAAAAQVGAYMLPTGGADSALLVTLQPGAYTVVITGANGSSGAALAETYAVP